MPILVKLNLVESSKSLIWLKLQWAVAVCQKTYKFGTNPT